MNIFDAIDHHAALRPFDLAVIHARGSVNYLQLRALVAGMGARLVRAGVTPGAIAAIYIADPFLHLATILGLMLNGTPSVSAHPNNNPMPPGLDVAFYLSDRDIKVPASARLVGIGADWARGEANGLFPAARGFADPAAVCRIITSSGTTGNAKSVAHSSASLEAMAVRQLSLDSIYAAGPNINMMALATIGGFNAAHYTLWAGSLLVLATGVGATLSAINLYNIRTLGTSTAQLQGLVTTLAGKGAHFPSLQQVRVGGSAMAPAMIRRARTLLCPTIIGIYGSTEAGLTAYAPGALLESRPGIGGYSLPGTEIRITDEQGASVGPDQPGIVQIRSPHMALGYLGDPLATEQAFRDGWFLPGDIGALAADGLLTIHGRQDELINAGGGKINPEIIDTVLLALPGVRDAAAFAVPGPLGIDEIWAAIVADGAFDEAALRQACHARLKSRAPQRFIAMAELPRNAMGKILRDRLRQAAESTGA